MVTTAAILSETFFVRWLEKSLYDCLEVLHGSFTDYGAIKSIHFRNDGIQDGCHDDRLGLGIFGLSAVGDEGDTYVDSGRRLFLVIYVISPSVSGQTISSAEPHNINNNRQVCNDRGVCQGHDIYPNCVLGLD